MATFEVQVVMKFGQRVKTDKEDDQLVSRSIQLAIDGSESILDVKMKIAVGLEAHIVLN